MPGRHSFQQVLSSVVITLCCAMAGLAHAEGSRSLYPASYPAVGARANLDLQPSQRYMNRVIRRGFLYVYAEQGEYIALGSSNIGTDLSPVYGGDINVYNPRDFGIPGDESLPSVADFSCSAGPRAGNTAPGPHFAGPDLGRLRSRAAELAGPNSLDGSATVSDGYAPCGYRAPERGIYGVLFTAADSGGNPNGRIDQVARSNNSVAGWEVTVRANASSLADLEGRVHTYAFLGFTGGNDLPIFSTLYYVTEDGYRYQQDLRGLDPNGYALYANTFGFLDDNEPLYKTLRGQSRSALVNALPFGVTAQPAEYPIFFSDISPGAVAETEMVKVLNALNIPELPPSPQISEVSFSGSLGGVITSTGVGGTFSFSTTDTVSYQIVISRDGADFDPANPLNRVLTGIAYSGAHQAVWDGLDNNLQPFPASATPYPYRAYGRNGEVHFPIIDAENNGKGAIAGGGPTITRLNGIDPNDRTVFFDDRGYLTRSGEAVGNLNGTLCPTNRPAAANPPVSLAGVDSSSSYRRWASGGNSNSDCNSGAGWGDAKGVNLWTYFLTNDVNAELEVREFPVDLASNVAMVDSAIPGNEVQGSFTFSNNGTTDVDAVSYSLTLSPGLGSVTFDNLPGSATADYDRDSGVVTLADFPATLGAGQSLAGMTFTFRAPATGPVSATTGITTSGAVDDSVPENNNAVANTALGDVDVATGITGIPASADTGSRVNGSVLFSNLGSQDALGISYSFTIGSPGSTPENVQFSSLPNGVSASYNEDTGVVTLSGMPGTLVVGQVISLGFSYVAPADDGANVTITSTIDTTSIDAVAANNNAMTSTSFVGEADVATAINGIPASVDTGSTVTGSVVFSNPGSRDALDVGYSFTIGSSGNTPENVQFSGLPDGVSASYNEDSGVVTLSGMPGTLVVGQEIALGFSYTAPAEDGANVAISSNITTSSDDAVAENNSALASTSFVGDDSLAAPSAVPVPALPLPALFLLLLALAGVAHRAMQMAHPAIPQSAEKGLNS